MKAVCRTLPALLGLVALLCLLSTARDGGVPRAAADEKPRPAVPPPLKVDKTAPLLLDEPPKKEKPQTAGPAAANNSACHVCHTNYQEEQLALSHARADIGCVKCHGQSIAHRNDEANITPPDTMYAPGKIDVACRACHRTHDVPAAKVIARWQERCPGRSDVKSIVCTDCHGTHRLKLRTVRWNKDTGKLLSSDSGKKAIP